MIDGSAASRPDETIAVWLFLCLSLWFLRRVQVRRPRPRRLVGLAGPAGPARHVIRPGALLGFLLTIPHPADAQERRLSLPSRSKLIASDPPGGPASKDLPDDLLAGPGTAPPWKVKTRGTRSEIERLTEKTSATTSRNVGAGQPRTSVHPAVHGDKRRDGAVTPLFPRAGANGKAASRTGDERPPEQKTCKEDERAELLACMRRHPSGKAEMKATHSAPAGPRSCRHVVRRGDTLWGLAAAHLQTDDIRRIARFWPLIHRQNLDVIGNNPDLLLPGQVLVIPSECE